MTTILIVNDFADVYATAIAQLFPQVEVLKAAGQAEALTLAARADAVVALGQHFNEALIAAAPRARWLHALTSGVDSILRAPSLRPDVAVTSSIGAHGPQMSEAALAMMLYMAREMGRMRDNQAAHRWAQFEPDLLSGATVAILGVGHIAVDLAQRCRALGMRTLGVTSRQRQVEGFDAIFTRDALAEAVAAARHLVVLLPLDASTRGLVDAKVMAALPRGAYLTNLSRGGIVVEADLLAALDSGHLAAAALDVFDTEPLPPESPFWDHPKVLVSPHIGGKSRTYREQVLPYLLDNLEHFLAGHPEAMRNLSAKGRR